MTQLTYYYDNIFTNKKGSLKLSIISKFLDNEIYIRSNFVKRKVEC